MKQVSNNGGDPHYYSKRLISKLDKLRYAAITVVEAPSGYGKTTAVCEYLETRLPQSTPIYWFTGTNEAPSSAYRRLCQNIEVIDGEVGRRLLKIEFPNAATIGDVIDAFRMIKCMHESYLVIDNFQLLYKTLPDSFLRALFEHQVKNLHIIFITQILRREQYDLVMKHVGLHINTADLRLYAEDIRNYFTLSDLNISLDEIQRITTYTEGWIIAVYMQLRAFREKGSVSQFDKTGILTLMENLIWDALTQEQRTFLLYLSPFESFTLQQACVLSNSSTLPKYILDLMENPFIRYEPLQKQYEIHSILSELLVQKRMERGEAFERECLLQAGDYCRDTWNIAKAVSYYYQIRDYERILLIDFSYIILDTIGDEPFSVIARDIALNCPFNIKKKYILSMLRIAWALLMVGMNSEFDTLMEELKTILDENTECDISPLLSEWTLLFSFQSYPNLKEMTNVLQQAAVLFKGKHSQVILPKMPWWFGEHSPFTAFHVEPGEAYREADDLEEYITVYSKLTQGHGSGADVLFRAEHAFHSGNMQESEILSHKALFLSENNTQSIIQLGASLRLAEIALQKADSEGWQNAINSMEQAASYSLQNTFIVRSVLDIVRGILFFELQKNERIADWIKEGQFYKSLLPVTITNDALFVYLNVLMNKGEYTKLIGTAEALLPQIGVGKPFIYLFLKILSAIGHVFTGNRATAEVLLRQAADIALPDGLVFPFAAYSWLLQGLADELIEREYPLHYEKFKEIKGRYGMGWDTWHNSIFKNELPADLTKREYEVALLASEGLRNGEIADRLVVSESTVRAHMRSIFQKLEIDRRSRLAEKLN